MAVVVALYLNSVWEFLSFSSVFLMVTVCLSPCSPALLLTVTPASIKTQSAVDFLSS